MTIGDLEKARFLNQLWGHLPRVTRRGKLVTDYDGTYEVRVECFAVDASVMTSEIRNSPGMHAPVLDLDFGAALIPSSTPGHHHLILEKAMTWRRYKRLVKALGKAGILEEGYVRGTLARGYSSIRVPWVKK